MPITTNTLAWWDVNLPGWRCAQCDQSLGGGVHDCPIDRAAPCSRCEFAGTFGEWRDMLRRTHQVRFVASHEWSGRLRPGESVVGCGTHTRVAVVTIASPMLIAGPARRVA